MPSDPHDRNFDPEVTRLIRGLQSLVEGESAIDELVACGRRAVPALRDFLLHGRVASVPQPRMWAAEAVARLGAREVLIEYLESPSRIADPQLSFAEEAVRNTAARGLGRWRDGETFAILLDLCRKRLLPGLIESVAAFERIEAIPYLDRALEDDMCRVAAEEGLRKLGSAARRALVLSAVTPLPNAGEETPSSLGRRRRIMALLAEMDPGAESWTGLRCLLHDSDPELLVRVGQIAARSAHSADRGVAAAALVGALGGVPWHVWKDAEDALIALAPEAVPAIKAELIRRASRPPIVRASDEVFRMLLRLQDRLPAFPMTT